MNHLNKSKDFNNDLDIINIDNSNQQNSKMIFRTFDAPNQTSIKKSNSQARLP